MDKKEALALIDKIIEEHKVIVQGSRDLERLANDASALSALEKSKEEFVPGRFDQGKTLKRLRESREVIDRGLQAHFSREEEGLLAVFVRYGDKELVSSLRSVLLEHEDLRNRFTQLQKHIDSHYNF